MRELHLFAGCGGGIYGGLLCGHRPVCAVEIEQYRRNVLIERQRDGTFPRFPIWDNVETFDGRPWRGRVDVVAGGFPCQDISAAGNGVGITGARSGLWKHQARIVGEVRPLYVLVENSPRLVGNGLAVVLSDLAEMGYDAIWGVLGAADAIWLEGTPCLDHERYRLWIVARDATRPNTDKVHEQGHEREILDTEGRSFTGERPSGSLGICPPSANGDSLRELQPEGSIGIVGGRDSNCAAPSFNPDEIGFVHTEGTGELHAQQNGHPSPFERGRRGKPDANLPTSSPWWAAEPRVDRMVHGLAYRGNRIAALGDGQIPSVVALAWRTLMP